MSAPAAFSLITASKTDALLLDQHRVLERIAALDRVAHHFEVTRFWSADLTASADPEHPAIPPQNPEPRR